MRLDPEDDDPPPRFSIAMSEAEMRELSFGRVPAMVQELAKTMTDWTQADLRRNAAKKVRLSKAGTRKGR